MASWRRWISSPSRGARGRRAYWVNLVSVTAVLALALLPAIKVAPIARADEGQYLEFYTPPEPLPPGKPGDLIRTEPSPLRLEPSGQLGAFVGTGTRIMYH